MDPERFEVVKRVLHALEEIAPDEQPAYLDRACADDPSLRAEVESLLGIAIPTLVRTGGLAARAAPLLVDDSIALGSHVGPYRLVEILGEGGMGVVYRAEQTVPLQRDVALKLVRPCMDSTRVVARFESERQSLALMDHPFIARVFDAGATRDGRPYFVMELVKGEPLTDYCAREVRSLEARLGLFLLVCEAVQHAHQKGIIHRDLKPSNVLLTRQGTEVVPKVIDFGIAKAIDEADGTLMPRTLDGQVLGTPEYMSPEQAGLLDVGVDTRTDVYALGVMLYELVSGRRPYDLATRTAAELDRVLRTPPKPPSRVATAQGRGPTGGASSDIDAVALMAMERLPADRYASVEQLADDVRRVMAHRPVRARTQTWTYRTSRFVRRNAAVVGTAALVGMVLVTTGLAVVRERNRAVASEARAVREAANARTEAAKASEVARFLTELFRESDPARARGASVTARELLQRGAQRVATELAAHDEVRATLMDTIGVVYRLLGLIDDSEALTTDALAIRRRALGAEHPDVAASLDNLGQIARERTTYDVAERFHREALDMRRRLLGPAHLDVAHSLNNLAIVLRERGQYDEAEALGRDALRIRRASLQSDHPDVLASLRLLADVAFSRGRFDEAEQRHREVLELRRRSLPVGHPLIASSANAVGDVLGQSGRLAEAEPLFREALAIRRHAYGSRHSEVAASLNNLASLLHDLGRWDEAEPLYREALAIDRGLHGSRHMDVAVDLNNLASLQEDRGRLQEAGRLFAESLAIRIDLQGERHPSVATVLNNLGRLRFTQGDLAGAERALRQAIEIRDELGTGRHPRQATSMVWLARVFQARGQIEEAERQYRAALAIEREAPGEASSGTAAALLGLGVLLVRTGQPAAAEPFLVEALTLRRSRLPAGHRAIGDAEAGLGHCYLAQSRRGDAEPLLQSALQTAPEPPGALFYGHRAVRDLLASLDARSNRAAETSAVKETHP